MEPRLIARAAALGLGAMALLAAVIFAWVLVYAYVVAPGHPPAQYQAYAARVAPLAGIVLGLPVFALAGQLAVRHRTYSLMLALTPAITFILLDAGLLGGFNWTLLTIIGPLLLALVIVVAVLRNRVSKDVEEQSERATRDLYREEDRIHADDDDEDRV